MIGLIANTGYLLGESADLDSGLLPNEEELPAYYYCYCDDCYYTNWC